MVIINHVFLQDNVDVLKAENSVLRKQIQVTFQKHSYSLIWAYPSNCLTCTYDEQYNLYFHKNFLHLTPLSAYFLNHSRIYGFLTFFSKLLFFQKEIAVSLNLLRLVCPLCKAPFSQTFFKRNPKNLFCSKFLLFFLILQTKQALCSFQVMQL